MLYTICALEILSGKTEEKYSMKGTKGKRLHRGRAVLRRIMSQAQNCHEVALRMNRLLCAMLIVYEYSLKDLKDEKMRIH